MIGQTISHYKILEKLGEGGMGVVYKAEDTKLRRPVALKFLSPEVTYDEQAKRRFMHEAQAVSALDHPNIAVVHEIDETDDGSAFICMAYYDGQTLKDRLKSGPIPPDEATRITLRIAEGLQRAHEAGIVHRDIKPANVIVTARGEVKILDFGIAKLLGEAQHTTTARTAGTAAYMSPEQAQGLEIDARSDLFSLGVVMYEMVTGRRPFAGEHDAALLYSLLNLDPKPPSALNPQISRELEAIILRLLEKDRAMRYQSAGDVHGELERLLGEGAVPRPLRRFPGTLRRGFSVPVLAGAVVVVLLVILYATGTLQRWLGITYIPKERYIAVLPFTNVGGSAENQAFCEGTVEILTSKLTELKKLQAGLAVVPAAEVRSRGVRSPSEARQLLGITLVLSGSIQPISGGLRVTVTLTDAVNLKQVGSRQIDEQDANVAALQDRLVQVVVPMLDFELPARTARFLASDTTSSPKASDYYVQAKGILQREKKPENLEKAIDLLQKAIIEDPYYTDAYDDLANAYVLKGDPGQAEAVLQRAIKMRPDYWRAYNNLGLFYYHQGRVRESERPFRRVIELAPDIVRGYNNLGGVYTVMGKYGEARRMYEQSLSVTPNYVAYNGLGGTFYFGEQQYEDAARMYEKAVSFNSLDYRVWVSLGSAYKQVAGKDSNAHAAYQRAAELAEERRLLEPRNSDLLVNLADIYSMLKKPDTSSEILNDALALPGLSSSTKARAAEIYEQLGMRDKAIEWIEKAVQTGYPLSTIEDNPSLNALRQDARYQKLKSASGK
jgi:tetratricopeptide (TPR) repeat protein/predicted Ser/Thr protein kinase